VCCKAVNITTVYVLTYVVNMFVSRVCRAKAWGQDKFGGQLPFQASHS